MKSFLTGKEEQVCGILANLSIIWTNKLRYPNQKNKKIKAAGILTDKLS